MAVEAHPLGDNRSWLLLLDPFEKQDPKKTLDLFRAEKTKADALLDDPVQPVQGLFAVSGQVCAEQMAVSQHCHGIAVIAPSRV